MAVRTPLPARAPAEQPVLGLGVLSGGLLALQQRLNGELTAVTGDPLATAAVSFAGGLLVVGGVVLARPASRRAWSGLAATRWWERLGGLGGATLVAVGATAAPQLGVALLAVGVVAGQVGGALVVDRVGLGPGGRLPLTAPRLQGALLCLVAVAVSGLGEGARAGAPLLLVATVGAGGLVAVQQALNGWVRAATGDAAVATAVNFITGTAALLLGLALRAAVSGVDLLAWPGPDRWWLYAGGPVGVLSVAAAALVVGRLGVLRLGLTAIAGQLVGAVLLDLLVPAPGAHLAAATLAGAVLTLLAVAVSGARTARP